MTGLYWAFYHVGGGAGILAAIFAAILLMWTLRDARRSALYICALCLVVCLVIMALCIAGMELTA